MIVKKLLSAAMAACMIICVLPTTVQGADISDDSLVEDMLFESGECELGKFSSAAFVIIIRDEPNVSGNTLYTTTVLMRIIAEFLNAFFSSQIAKIFLSLLNFQEPFKVYGSANSQYYKIEYLGQTGYVLKSNVTLAETQQVVMSRSRLDIYAGATKSLSLKDGSDPTDYDWSSSNSSVAYYDAANKKVVTGKAGTTTIIGVNGDKCAYCSVAVINRWIREIENQNVNGETNATVTATTVTDAAARLAPGTAENIWITIPQGTVMDVLGNVGKWLYVHYKYKSVDYYHYMYYNDLTTNTSDKTKGDRLFYATLGWQYPVKDSSVYNNISSPYGPRKISPQNHVGVDIVGSVSGKIEQQELIAVCDGMVREVGWNSDMGNYISITTDYIDPVTNNKLVIVYMHLFESPKYQKDAEINKGAIIALAGNTGNSNGAHLHFDVNNENKNYSSSSDFGYSINPIYFFPTQKVVLQSCSSYNGLYWPGIEY